MLTITSTTCHHEPVCSSAGRADHASARVVARHPEQGWSLLCNGVVLFDDGGELLPGGHVVDPAPATTSPRLPLAV
jgi:hypothetical protein